MSTIFHMLLGAAPAFLVGVFMPAVMREIKSWFSKAATAVAADIKAKL
jgi:hypothetical protein